MSTAFTKFMQANPANLGKMVKAKAVAKDKTMTASSQISDDIAPSTVSEVLHASKVVASDTPASASITNCPSAYSAKRKAYQSHDAVSTPAAKKQKLGERIPKVVSGLQVPDSPSSPVTTTELAQSKTPVTKVSASKASTNASVSSNKRKRAEEDSHETSLSAEDKNSTRQTKKIKQSTIHKATAIPLAEKTNHPKSNVSQFKIIPYSFVDENGRYRGTARHSTAAERRAYQKLREEREKRESNAKKGRLPMTAIGHVGLTPVLPLPACLKYGRELEARNAARRAKEVVPKQTLNNRKKSSASSNRQKDVPSNSKAPQPSITPTPSAWTPWVNHQTGRYVGTAGLDKKSVKVKDVVKSDTSKLFDGVKSHEPSTPQPSAEKEAPMTAHQVELAKKRANLEALRGRLSKKRN